MKKNICIRESYTDKNGEEKVNWFVIGEIIQGKNGKEYAKLYHMPNTLCSIFEQKKKEGKPAPKETEVDVDKDDQIPF